MTGMVLVDLDLDFRIIYHEKKKLIRRDYGQGDFVAPIEV